MKYLRSFEARNSKVIPGIITGAYLCTKECNELNQNYKSVDIKKGDYVYLATDIYDEPEFSWNWCKFETIFERINVFIG